ncbi:hypothetical protein [Nonomuraea sp. NPDC002799]
MAGRHEDPNSGKDQEVTGKEGGVGSTNDQYREPQGEHAKDKKDKKQ